MLSRLRSRALEDRGMVLPIALGLLMVMSIMVVTIVNYSSSNSRAFISW